MEVLLGAKLVAIGDKEQEILHVNRIKLRSEDDFPRHMTPLPVYALSQASLGFAWIQRPCERT